MFVTNVLDNTVTVIDSLALKPIRTVSVGQEPHHMAVMPDEQYLLVGNASSNDLTVLDLADGQPVKRITGVLDPYDLMFSPDHGYMVTVCTRLNIIQVYDTQAIESAVTTLGKEAHLTSLRTVKTDDQPNHLQFSPDSKMVYVTNEGSRTVSFIDFDQGRVVATVHVGRRPVGLAITKDGQRFLSQMRVTEPFQS